MRTSSLSSYVFSLAAIAAAVGCASSDTPAPTEGPAEPTGTLQLPLTQAGPDGTLYHLSGSFSINSQNGITAVDATGNTPTVTVALPPGLISIQLLDGWTLAQSTDGGATFTPVDALLGTSNPSSQRILANQPLTVGFTFLVRTTVGQLTIGFGVDTSPRELAGGIVVDNDPLNATGAYVSYAHARMDFANYYTLAGTQDLTQVDGSKDRTFFSDAMAMEFFNDGLGLLRDQVGPAMAGGFLQYTVSVKPDGSQVLTGEIDSFGEPFTTILLGPTTLTNPVPVDANGFATDAFIFESFLTFTMQTGFDSGEASMFGQLRFRAIP